MDCLRMRSPPAHFHYLISEQAKSIVALQELQNEVGALLEFRDLVIETFPNLRSKMGAPAGARRPTEWEAGVRVRRKPPAAGAEKPGKPQPSVQDSGFSTETSSSKEAHSSTRAAPLAAADELWLLLDAAQRRAAELCEPSCAAAPRSRRARSLSSSSDSPPASPSPSPSPSPRGEFALALDAATDGEARELRRERDRLLDKLAGLEGEALAGRALAARADADRRQLEAQLRAAVAQRDRLDARLRERLSPPASLFAPPSPFTPKRPNDRLGILDRVLNTPIRTPRVRTPDTKKINAILKEDNPVELQRHLLNYTVWNQVLLERLQKENRTKEELLERLDKMKEENDDLRFQLDEKRVELDGTKGRLRAFEETETETRDRSPCTVIRRPRDDRGEGAHSSMRALGPLPDHLQMQDERGKTEQDRITDTPKRNRSSRIPLLGSKTLAPKPPSGRTGASGTRPERAEPASYRSRSGDSFGRPSSAQSYRNNGSLGPKAKDSISSSKSPGAGVRNAASSIAKPIGKDSLGRSREGFRSGASSDSLTGKVKNNDSLSRMRDSPLNDSNYSSKPRKESTASFAGDVKKIPTAPARRASHSASRVTLADPKDDAKSPLMRLKLNLWFPDTPQPECSSFPDSLDRPVALSTKNIISEYLDRTDRLAQNEQLILDRIRFASGSNPSIDPNNLNDKNLFIDELDSLYERPQNLALELIKSDTLASATASNMYSMNHTNHGDYLWNGKPQQYFDSINNLDILESDNSYNLNSSVNNVKREGLAECDSLEKRMSGGMFYSGINK